MIHLAFNDPVVSWRETNYACVKGLGSGGSAKVYSMLATSGLLKGQLFAVKFFIAQAKSDRWHSNFMKEIHFLRSCDHPAIIRVFDEGILDKQFPFVVMEHMQGSLDDLYKRKIDLVDSRKISIVVQLLSALNYLSRLDPPGVHCDIKPKNILFKGTSCVLSDFGLVALRHSEDDPESWSPPDALPQAQCYRTPELVPFSDRGTPFPPASDVFQLGLVATELFTGMNPLNPKGKDKKVELNPPGTVPGKHADTITALLMDMLNRDTDSRISARDALRRWQELLVASYAPDPSKPQIPRKRT